jgi:hypothetical protein
MIEYSIEVYIEWQTRGLEASVMRIGHKKEIDVREYLFTDQEIEDDWKNYQKILDLKKVLRPNTIFGSKNAAIELAGVAQTVVVSSPSGINPTTANSLMPEVEPVDNFFSDEPALIEENKDDRYYVNGETGERNAATNALAKRTRQ